MRFERDRDLVRRNHVAACALSVCYSTIYLLYLYKGLYDSFFPQSSSSTRVFWHFSILPSCRQTPHNLQHIRCPWSPTPQEFGSSMFTGHCTASVESGIREGVASTSGSVFETVGDFPIHSGFCLTFASDDSTPGSEVSIDCFALHQAWISDQHIISPPMPNTGATLHAGELR